MGLNSSAVIMAKFSLELQLAKTNAARVKK
jgi:hypothetical protein